MTPIRLSFSGASANQHRLSVSSRCFHIQLPPHLERCYTNCLLLGAAYPLLSRAPSSKNQFADSLSLSIPDKTSSIVSVSLLGPLFDPVSNLFYLQFESFMVVYSSMCSPLTAYTSLFPCYRSTSRSLMMGMSILQEA